MSGEMTSPWSIPSPAINGVESPYSVIIFIERPLNKLMIKFLHIGGNLMHSRALASGTMPTESKALAMSWNATQHSFLVSWLSSKMLWRMWIGVLVSPPFSPAKFGPLSTLCCRQILERRFVRTLTTSFRKHSNNRIGRVRPRLYSHSYGLGIGYSWETRHLSGMFPSLNKVPAKVRRISCVAGLAFF